VIFRINRILLISCPYIFPGNILAFYEVGEFLEESTFLINRHYNQLIILNPTAFINIKIAAFIERFADLSIILFKNI